MNPNDNEGFQSEREVRRFPWQDEGWMEKDIGETLFINTPWNTKEWRINTNADSTINWLYLEPFKFKSPERALFYLKSGATEHRKTALDVVHQHLTDTNPLYNRVMLDVIEDNDHWDMVPNMERLSVAATALAFLVIIYG